MSRNEITEKGRQISWAVSIIAGLRSSLDHQSGGEIASNLEDLYLYMEQRLLKSNLENDGAILDEVTALMREISAGWNGIANQVSRQS